MPIAEAKVPRLFRARFLASLSMKHHLVSPLLFRFVEGLVRLAKGEVGVSMGLWAMRYPHRNRDVPDAGKNVSSDAFPESFTDLGCGKAVDSRKKDEEFFSSNPAQDVFSSSVVPHQLRNANNDLVPRWMTEAVIDVLEMVYVERHDPKWQRRLLNLAQSAVQAPAVEKASQRVGERSLVEPPNLLAQGPEADQHRSSQLGCFVIPRVHSSHLGDGLAHVWTLRVLGQLPEGGRNPS